MQMIILRDRPLANDHPEGEPLANDYPKGQVSCKWLSRGTGLLKIIICHLCQDPYSISRTFVEQSVVVSHIRTQAGPRAGCDPDYGWLPGAAGTDKCYMLIKSDSRCAYSHFVSFSIGLLAITHDKYRRYDSRIGKK